MTVFNKKAVDFTKQPMFFGEKLNTQRFDQFKYPKFDQLNEQMLSFFWRPQEVSLQKDQGDFKTLPEHHKHIFISNLKFQTLLDSIQGRGPILALLPIVSLPELENAVLTWDFFEGSIHSKSYSYIMQNVFSNPTEIFDDIVVNEEILKRASSITKYYDDYLKLLYKYLDNEKSVDIYTLKKSLYMAIININILEAIRFYVSFACSFAFGENKLMEGSAKILSLIARDENVHFALTTNILNYWRSTENDPHIKQIEQETHDDVIALYNEVIQQEKDWAKYLFKDGTIIGLNEKLLCQYVDHMAVKRAKNIGYKLNIDAPKSNPLPWTQNWLSSKGLQEAPMETEKESYIIGGIKQDLDKINLKSFDL